MPANPKGHGATTPRKQCDDNGLGRAGPVDIDEHPKGEELPACVEVEPKERNQFRMSLTQASPRAPRRPAVVLAIPDLDTNKKRCCMVVESTPGFSASRVSEHRSTTPRCCIREQLVGCSPFAEEGKVAPNGNVREVGRIRILNARHEQSATLACCGAGFPIGPPTVLVEAAIMLRHQHRVIAALAEIVSQRL